MAECANLLGLFRSAALLLDEVDLVLHPLKSELNWPLDEKVPLDFTTGERPGLRWRLPFFLLDALFYVRTGMLSVDGVADSPRAMGVLAELRRAVDIGVELQHLQTSPHLLLLSRSFYDETLKPLLARWLVHFLRQQKLRVLDDRQLLAYLLGRERPAGGVLERAPDEHMKLLNLGND